MSKKNLRYVLVTTDFRGVFVGYLKDESQAPQKITLRDARMVISWSGGGLLRVASDGPKDGDKYTPAVPSCDLWKITSIMDCTEEAAAKLQEVGAC